LDVHAAGNPNMSISTQGSIQVWEEEVISEAHGILKTWQKYLNKRKAEIMYPHPIKRNKDMYSHDQHGNEDTSQINRTA
jgi:hypothetical protein